MGTRNENSVFWMQHSSTILEKLKYWCPWQTLDNASEVERLLEQGLNEMECKQSVLG